MNDFIQTWHVMNFCWFVEIRRSAIFESDIEIFFVKKIKLTNLIRFFY